MTGSRVRVRSDAAFRNPVWIWSGDGVQQNYFGWNVFTRYERMEDWPGPGRVKPAFHTVVRMLCDDFTSFPGDNGHYVTVLPGQKPAGVPGEFVSRMPEWSVGLGQGLGLEAYNHFQTRFPELISSSEFVLGFGKLKELLPKLSDSIVATLSNAYLTKKFGWDNLLSDLTILSGLTTEIEARLRWLRKSRGKPVTLHFYRPDVLQHDLEDFSGGPGYRAWGTDYRNGAYKLDFRASATLVHDLKFLDSELGYWQAMIAAAGLNRPLKAIWANLPLSFVVDWFLNVSGHLDRVSTIQPAEEWSISDVTHSWKATGTWDVYQNSTPVFGSATSGLYERRGKVVVTQYHRHVGLPLRWDQFDLSGLTPSSLALLLAMGGSKVR